MTGNEEYEEVVERGSFGRESSQNILREIISGWWKLRKLVSGKTNAIP